MKTYKSRQPQTHFHQEVSPTIFCSLLQSHLSSQTHPDNQRCYVLDKNVCIYLVRKLRPGTSATPGSSLRPWGRHQTQSGTSVGSRPEPACCRCCTASPRVGRCSWQSRCQKCPPRRQSPPGFQELCHTQCTHHRLNKEIDVKDRLHHFWERWKHIFLRIWSISIIWCYVSSFSLCYL